MTWHDVTDDRGLLGVLEFDPAESIGLPALELQVVRLPYPQDRTLGRWVTENGAILGVVEAATS